MKEWLGLRAEAKRLVCAGSSEKEIKVFRLAIFPSFTNMFSWEIIERKTRKATPHDARAVSPFHEGGGFQLVRTVWRMDTDVEKFRSPIERMRYPRSLTPTLEQTHWPAPSANVQEWLGSFSSIKLPALITSNSFGLDGTSYEFSFGDGFLWATYHWWDKAPDKWKELEDRFQATIRDFEELVKNA